MGDKSFIKVMFFIVISYFISISTVSAQNPADGLNKIPEKFKPECYEYYNKIDKSEVWNNVENKRYKTYKVKVNTTEDLVITQLGFIIPYKYYSEAGNIYEYENSLGLNNKYLLDYNSNTYREINSKTQNEIILNFKEPLKKGSFSFIFRYISNNYKTQYFISADRLSWDEVKREDIEDFDFQYLKIKFVSKTPDVFLENIEISELNFVKKSSTILVKSHYNDDIELYAKYNCKTKEFSTKALDYNNFSIDTGTKTIILENIKNPKYNVYTKKDYDNDWVEDALDNCKYRYNPQQLDSNGDGHGDVCSDDDGDMVIGYYDNCPSISNKDQKDINRNGVGDVCEFDKDEDGIFDILDNCINTSNPDQKDDDRDNIGNTCDNCKIYNPRQLDKDNNGIGDVCDAADKELEENDVDGDSIIDWADNCKDVANVNQADFDKDGVGDACDNCKQMQNTDQLDLLKNGVGDICEDSDDDGLQGLIDNCIHIANPDQKDFDNNGTGDLCEDSDNDRVLFADDNCPYDYNPKQGDIDKDKIGDACDEGDNRFIESNKTFFLIIMLFVVILFGGGIFMMIKRLK